MYYQKIALALTASALVGTVYGDGHDRWKTEVRETISHVFSGDKTLDVDNINGFVRVVGDTGATIRMEGEKVIRALDRESVDRAQREVTLDMNEKNGVAQFYVNGPFRGHQNQSDHHGFHDHDSYNQYEVTYNLTIHVPRETMLQLRNVNGSTTAEQTSGHFEVSAVNGPLIMTGVAGSGSARAVNGPMTVSFRESPKGPTEFHTVNGRIDAAFPPTLSADLRFKTLNGVTYSDFDVAPVAVPAEPGERKNGRFVFKSNRTSSVRVGAGGPPIDFETVNGAITIKKGTN